MPLAWLNRSSGLLALIAISLVSTHAQETKPSRVDGIWLGALELGSARLRLQLQATTNNGGKQHCTVDSLDQGAMGLPCEIRLDGNRCSFDVPVVQGRWSGILSDDGNELTGTWSQRNSLPLRLTRQASALAAKKIEPPKFDPAMAAVPLKGMKAVLDHDIAPALGHGALAPATNGGVVIGVLQHGNRLVLTYGDAKPDAILEIGSISKTFTGLIFAQLIEREK